MDSLSKNEMRQASKVHENTRLSALVKTIIRDGDKANEE